MCHTTHQNQHQPQPQQQQPTTNNKNKNNRDTTPHTPHTNTTTRHKTPQHNNTTTPLLHNTIKRVHFPFHRRHPSTYTFFFGELIFDYITFTLHGVILSESISDFTSHESTFGNNYVKVLSNMVPPDSIVKAKRRARTSTSRRTHTLRFETWSHRLCTTT